MHPVEKFAQVCFEENVQSFAPRSTRPEQYNLYRGLAALAEVIEVVYQKQHTLQSQLDSLAHAMTELTEELKRSR